MNSSNYSQMLNLCVLLTITSSIVEVHWTSVDVKYACYHTIEVKTLDKDPGKCRRIEILEQNGYQPTDNLLDKRKYHYHCRVVQALHSLENNNTSISSKNNNISLSSKYNNTSFFSENDAKFSHI